MSQSVWKIRKNTRMYERKIECTGSPEIKQLQKRIPDLEAVIVISHNGDLLDYDITKSNE